MKKKLEQNELFRKGDSVLPSVYWDMILAEYGRPILFTCLDEYNQLYICSCYHAGGDAVEWMLVKTTEEAVIKLLQNQIPIHDMFSEAETVYLLTLSERGAQPQAVKKAAQDVPEHYFPTAGYDMDAEEGEFDEEIAELRERIAERESDLYETILSVQIEPFLFSYSVWKPNALDMTKAEQVLTDVLKSRRSCFSLDALYWQSNVSYEEQLFRLSSVLTRTNVSAFPRKERMVKFSESRSDSYKASIPVVVALDSGALTRRSL